MAARAGKSRRRRRRLGPVRLVLLLAMVGVAGWVAYRVVTWPDVAALARRNPATTAYIDLWRRERRREGLPDQPAWNPVPSSSISAELKIAVLVAEDIGFFSHDGFDRHEMREAVQEALKEGDLPRGASTLTQQLARNLWLSPSQNPVRKIEEAILTRSLERDLGKRRILELYLNVAEFGPGVYGADAAARRYFGVPASELDEDQAAALAAALPRPSSWHPGSRSPGYAKYTRTIRRRMERADWLRKDL